MNLAILLCIIGIIVLGVYSLLGWWGVAGLVTGALISWAAYHRTRELG